jgi:hypothetical protein
VNCGYNRKTQYFVSMIDDNAVTNPDAPVLDDVQDAFSDSFESTDDLDHQYNVVPFRHTQDYCGREKDGWRSVQSGVLEVDDNVSIANYGLAGEPLRLPAPTLFLAMIRGVNRSTDYAGYAQGSATAADVLQRYLMRHTDPPRIVSLTIGPRGANIEMGEIVLVSHYAGISAAGWTGRPMRVIKHEFNPADLSVTLGLFDMQEIYATGLILGDETVIAASWGSASFSDKVYAYLCDEGTGQFSDGDRGKRLR